MTDSTTTQIAAPTDDTRWIDRLGATARAVIGAVVRAPRRAAELHGKLRDERDFDRIHDALASLNERQLGKLGLSRDTIYGFVEVCVFDPDRRPELRLYEPGPALALVQAKSEASVTIEGEAAAETVVKAEVAETETPETEVAETETPETETEAAEVEITVEEVIAEAAAPAAVSAGS
ncbi:MAG: hypothetical protein AAF677_07785 [Pseudomonadota bacterium]